MAMMRRSTNYCFLIVILSYFVAVNRFSCIPVSLAGNTIRVGQAVREWMWESIESSNNLFLLQFFGTGELRPYFGIKHKPSDNVVWVANDFPLQGGRGQFKITQDGKMVLSDHITGEHYTIYDHAQHPATAANYNTTSATLLDTGNLVLQVGDHIMWQSFDHPFDTWLPGMKLGVFRSTSGQAADEHRFLSSSRPGAYDVRGAFTLGVDPSNSTELVIWRGRVRLFVYWRSGSWKGHNFSYFPFIDEWYSNDLVRINFSYFSNESQSYFSYTTERPLFFHLSSDGNINIASFDGDGGDLEYPTNVTNCDDDRLYLRNKGCANPETTACWMGPPVFDLTHGAMEFEDRLEDDTLDINDCKFLCTLNCSCDGYAILYRDGGGCRFFRGKLVPVQETLIGASFYLRNGPVEVTKAIQPTSPRAADNWAKKWLWLIFAGPVASVLILTLLSLFCYLKKNRNVKGNDRRSKDGMNQGMHSLMYDLKNKLAIFDDKHNHGKNDFELPFYHFSSIRIATDDFSDTNKIGQGGFGPVYKGKLDNGQEIAVKRLLKNSQQGLEEFKNEIILISKLQHRNLVKLLGCCVQEDERILIYEYMPNKSLDSFIFDVKRKALLDWKMRASIIQGIAQGLLYLHKYSRLRIIHRDLKTSNILLDNSMNPRISDFGTARIFGDNESRANTNRIVGTYGYMSPEYALDGLFSEKSDIFGFGVMTLEIISGKKNTGFYQPDRALNLLGYAWDLWNEERGLEIMDDVLVETYSTSEILRYIQVGFLCVQESPANRPIISEVLSMLNNEMIVIPTPKQPAFSTIVSAYHASTPEIPKSCTLIDITISEEGGR